MQTSMRKSFPASISRGVRFVVRVLHRSYRLTYLEEVEPTTYHVQLRLGRFSIRKAVKIRDNEKRIDGRAGEMDTTGQCDQSTR